MIQDVLSGVVGGLISTIIILIFTVIWTKSVVPWFEERIYKAAHVEGSWYGEIVYDDGNTERFEFLILRQSYRISGNMKSTGDHKEFEISGDFKNNLMTIIYSSRVMSEIDRGCFTLVLTKNGQELSGQAAYYYSHDYSVKVAPIVLHRNHTATVSNA